MRLLAIKCICLILPVTVQLIFKRCWWWRSEFKSTALWRLSQNMQCSFFNGPYPFYGMSCLKVLHNEVYLLQIMPGLNDVNERNYRKKTNALKQHIPAIHLGVSIFVIPHSLRWLAVVTRNPLSIIRRQSK